MVVGTSRDGAPCNNISPGIDACRHLERNAEKGVNQIVKVIERGTKDNESVLTGTGAIPPAHEIARGIDVERFDVCTAGQGSQIVGSRVDIGVRASAKQVKGLIGKGGEAGYLSSVV